METQIQIAARLLEDAPIVDGSQQLEKNLSRHQMRVRGARRYLDDAQ